MLPDWALQVFGMIAGAGGVYAAIRADLARLNEVARQAAQSATEAHARIDACMLNRRSTDRERGM
jgi:hypothetical protein